MVGGPGKNSFLITSTIGNGIVAKGGSGSNAYTITMGNLLGPVTINSTTGTSTVTVNGPSGSNVLTLTSTQLTGDGETINFNVGSTVSNFTVSGGAGNNNQLVVQGTPPGPVTAQSLAPTVGAITAPLAPAAINTAITASVSFTNLDGNSQTAVWNWGDGTTSTGTVSQTGTTGTVTGSHSYTADGVFTITLTVKDSSGGGSGTSLFQYVVIYNPNGGFVTGGGWITSPAGAYIPNLSLTGRTDFGIDIKYKSGSTAPTGTTQFTLPAAGQSFQSTSYAWLTISGTMAQFQGTGTINGAGSYGFIVTVTDGDLLGGTVPDTFRNRIWDSTKGNGTTSAGLIYDNYPSAPVYNDPSGTALGGGSIVIHKSNQRAAGGPGPNLGQGPDLTSKQLQPIVAAAIARWQEAGATLTQVSPLAHLTYQIFTLPPGILAMTGPGIIWVSPNAAGYGWFLDPNPTNDSAFTGMADSLAGNHMDLLSVMAHELGHIILNMDESSQPNDVMTEALPLGVRRLPTPSDLGLQPSTAWASSHTSTGLKEPILRADRVSVLPRDSLFAVGQPIKQFSAALQAQQPETWTPGPISLRPAAPEAETLFVFRQPESASDVVRRVGIYKGTADAWESWLDNGLLD